MDGLLLFIGVCILNSLRQLVEYYFSQGLTKPLLTIPRCIPGLAVTTDHILVCEDGRFEITSVEDVKGRGMYTEVLAKKVVATNG